VNGSGFWRFPFRPLDVDERVPALERRRHRPGVAIERAKTSVYDVARRLDGESAVLRVDQLNHEVPQVARVDGRKPRALEPRQDVGVEVLLVVPYLRPPKHWLDLALYPLVEVVLDRRCRRGSEGLPRCTASAEVPPSPSWWS
jgi:hypothetical protein